MQLPISIRLVAPATAARITGALRRNRSLLTQNWSKPTSSAACASATYSGSVRSLFSRRLKRIAGPNLRLGLDFNQILIADQLRLHQRVGRPDRAKALAMHARHRLPIGDTAHIHARPHDIAQRSAQLADRRLDLIDNTARL